MDFAFKLQLGKLCSPKIEVSTLFTLLTFTLVNLAVLSLSRLMLSTWQADHFTGTDELMRVMAGGFRIDVSTLSYALLPLVLLTLLSGRIEPRKYLKRLTHHYLIALSVVMTFLELITPICFDQGGLRPHPDFFASAMLPFLWLASHKWELLVDLVTLFFYAKVLSSLFTLTWNPDWPHYLPSGAASHRLLAALVLVVLIAGARGSIFHSPLDASSVAFSSDSLLNQLSLNSTYALFTNLP